MATQKKIALITSDPSVLSGVSVFMDLLAKQLKKNGYDARLVAPSPTKLKKVTNLGYIVGYAYLREELKKFDLIIGNSVGLAGSLDLDVKTIYNAHNTSIGGNLALRSAYEQLTADEIMMLDTVLDTVCHTGVDAIEDSLKQNKAFFEIDRMLAQKADSIIAVSPSVRQYFIDNYQLPKKKVSVVYNGIDSEWFMSRAIDPSMQGKQPNVVFVSRANAIPSLVFRKGIDRALRVLASVKGARPVAFLHISEKTISQRYAKLLRAHKVTAKFNLDNTQLRNYLRAGDIFVFTSRVEAFGYTVIEAMASGMVPVCFPAGIASDVIDSGENGYIVSSVEEMEMRVAELAKNPELRRQMGEKARLSIQERFTIDKMIKGYMEAIGRII